MLIKVLKTTKASKNELGIEVFEYLQGETYDIYQELAEVFLKEGWGEKAIDNLENKDIKPKKGNKNAK